MYLCRRIGCGVLAFLSIPILLSVFVFVLLIDLLWLFKKTLQQVQAKKGNIAVDTLVILTT